MRLTGVERLLVMTALVVAIMLPCAAAQEDDGETVFYVGSDACESCHPDQFERFAAYAKKANSYHSVETMQKGLTEAEIKGCYKCHTTGYGKPGGFVSETETPQLKNAGCEVCHGPGGRHVDSEDPDDIVTQVDMDSCVACHDADRVAAFNFKPMTKAGAH